MTEELQSEPVVDGEEYVVEKIIDDRLTKKGKLEYFLKWKGENINDFTITGHTTL